jgi:hypothetical protein
LEDILPPKGMDELGYRAVMNAINASQTAGDRWGKAQAIVERQGKLTLATDAKGKPLIGKAVESREFNMVMGRLKPFEYHLEKAPCLKGDVPKGDGHYHKDKTGKETKDFSDIDRQRTREGLWIYKANESSPHRVERLTPQTDGSEAKARLVLPPSGGAQDVEPAHPLSEGGLVELMGGTAGVSHPPLTVIKPL